MPRKHTPILMRYHAREDLITSETEKMVDVDTQDDFAVGDMVSYEYHGTRLTGYIASFERESYLFALKDGTIRPYAHVVPDWSKRDLKPYGYCVLLESLTPEANLVP